MAITFTLEEIKAAYKATGQTPLLRGWTDGWKDSKYTKCCPLGVLLTKRCGMEKVRQVGAMTDPDYSYFSNMAASELGMTIQEVESFIAGVDGRTPPLSVQTAAFQFGCKVAEALFEQSSTEVQ